MKIKEAIQLRGVVKRFDDRLVLDHFSCEIPYGLSTCLMGPSGSGKTTLLNLILGLIQPDEGIITGVPAKVGVVFQEDRLCESFSCLSNVRMVTSGKSEEAKRILSRLQLEEDIYKPVSQLSGGMRRRVAIARALAFNADFYVFDEAFKGLDTVTRQIVFEVVKEHTKGKTAVFVTHDVNEAAFFGDRLIDLEATV